MLRVGHQAMIVRTVVDAILILILILIDFVADDATAILYVFEAATCSHSGYLTLNQMWWMDLS